MLYRLPTTTNNLFAPHSISYVRLTIREMFETNLRLKFNQINVFGILFKLAVSEWISKASLYVEISLRSGNPSLRSGNPVNVTETLVYGAETIQSKEKYDNR
tara:strand:- start:32 stop:337 length:306 start_codon:yes stop_codon:yes gene_type:complete